MINTQKVILIGFLIVIICTSSKRIKEDDYFEGKIMYKNTYILKTNSLDSEYIHKIFGKTAELYFKDGNYLEKYDGGFILEQIFVKAENKSYMKKNQSDTLFWFDCGMPGQKMLKFENNAKKEKILGIDCDEMITYYQNKIVTFYYNSDSLKIDPEWYKNYTAFNKDKNAQKMRSIYLKYKVEYPNFTIIVTATSISRQKIDDSIFVVSKTNKILVEDK